MATLPLPLLLPVDANVKLLKASGTETQLGGTVFQFV